MRMTPRWKDEGGAVLVMVALMLTAILGLVVLVVDVGGLLVKRRQLVAAADSASLAAAHSCALDKPEEAAAKADEYAHGNAADARLAAYTPSACGGNATGSVGVTYTASQPLYFAPALGFADSKELQGSSTALWGPSLTTEPTSIVVLIDDPRSCVPSCALWADPDDLDDSSSDQQAGFAILSQWGRRSSCSRSSSLIDDWIRGDERDRREVTLPDGGSSSVCALTDPSMGSIISALRSQRGLDKIVLVADRFVRTSSNRGWFSVQGYAPLRIEDALRGDDEAAVGREADDGPCIGLSLSVSFSGRGDTLDLAPRVLACLLAFGADAVWISEVDGPGNCCSSPDDYSIDAETNVITWNRRADARVRIFFRWSREATAGVCGTHPPDDDAACLILSWQGTRVGGTQPSESTANDFGVRAVRIEE
jgi:Flp pilus assembly protein TadG